MSARLHLEQASPQTRPAHQELPETFAIDISSTSSTPMVMGGECPSRLLAGFRPGYAAVSNSESKPPPSPVAFAGYDGSYNQKLPVKNSPPYPQCLRAIL